MLTEVHTLNDTTMINLIESPGNKTVKSLSEIKWALDRCSAPFLLHLPDDFDIDVQKVGEMLDSNWSVFQNGSVWCQTYQDHAAVKREGRWMVPMDEYFEDTFPPYCSGGHYFMAKDAAKAIYENALVTENFRFHDVHIR